MIYYDPSYSPHRPERKSGYSIGGELMVFEGVYFRYGLNKGVTQAHLAKVGNGMGYGLGIVFPKLTLDATYYRSMTPLYSESKMGSMTISF